MNRGSRPGHLLHWNPRTHDASVRPGDEFAGQDSRAPAKTHAEERYYRRHMEARTPVVVVTVSGDRFPGWIEWYDRDVLKLHSLVEPNRFIYKDEILYICDHADEPDPKEPVPTPPPLTGRGRRRRGPQA